ncbi:MAG: hypothetical protein WA902_11240 [Thermosynechococcaceae cyanobacterium]
MESACIKVFRRQIKFGLSAAILLGVLGQGSTALSCFLSKASRDVLRLRDTEYAELPEGLCPGYSDTLLGKTQQFEYGGVVCDRTEGSYIFLQRLVGYTPQKRAIWKIVEIQRLAQTKDNERVVSAGCIHTQKSNQPIFAVVETSQAPNYKVLRAWAIDLEQEQLKPMPSKWAACTDPLF